ncbi:MAG: hypothetical protein VX642_09810 [Bdellovibrionota bacterium]|nr:hypothetical protein [Bdellovibrionota bacterium]
MKILKGILIGVLCLFTHNKLQAQVFIETDPAAFVLKGHSLHIGYQLDSIRFQVGSFAAQYPDFILKNNNFEVFQSGYGFKIDIWGAEKEGLFMGIDYSKTTASYKLKTNSLEVKKDIDLIGPRIGYRFFWGKSIYVSSWLSIYKNLKADSESDTITIDGESYEQEEYTVFPAVHIGFQF